MEGSIRRTVLNVNEIVTTEDTVYRLLSTIYSVFCFIGELGGGENFNPHAIIENAICKAADFLVGF